MQKMLIHDENFHGFKITLIIQVKKKKIEKHRILLGGYSGKTGKFKG